MSGRRSGPRARLRRHWSDEELDNLVITPHYNPLVPYSSSWERPRYSPLVPRPLIWESPRYNWPYTPRYSRPYSPRYNPQYRGYLRNHRRTTPTSLTDQNFGLGLLNDDLMELAVIQPKQVGYMRSWRLIPGRLSGVSNVTLNDDGFKVNLDVQQFRGEELTVKVVDDHVGVEGQHEERVDEHGHISRSFKRRYRLPEEVDRDAVTSCLSSDGVLTIVSAPKKAATIDLTELLIPIILSEDPAPDDVLKSADAGQREEEMSSRENGDSM